MIKRIGLFATRTPDHYHHASDVLAAWEIHLFFPDEKVHCCELTPSYEIEHVDTEFFLSVRDEYNDRESDLRLEWLSGDAYRYVHCRVIDSPDSRVVYAEVDIDEEDDDMWRDNLREMIAAGNLPLYQELVMSLPPPTPKQLFENWREKHADKLADFGLAVIKSALVDFDVDDDGNDRHVFNGEISVDLHDLWKTVNEEWRKTDLHWPYGLTGKEVEA